MTAKQIYVLHFCFEISDVGLDASIVVCSFSEQGRAERFKEKINLYHRAKMYEQDLPSLTEPYQQIPHFYAAIDDCLFDFVVSTQPFVIKSLTLLEN